MSQVNVPRSLLRAAGFSALLATFTFAACGGDDADTVAGSSPVIATTPAKNPNDAPSTTPSKALKKAIKAQQKRDAAAKKVQQERAAAAAKLPKDPRAAKVVVALRDADFKVNEAATVPPARAVLKVGSVSIVFYGTKAEAKQDASQFEQIFKAQPDQGAVVRKGRRVYFVTATGKKLSAEQRADFEKITTLSEAAATA